MEQGVIVGCDKFQEWLLPWWWHNYIQHNDYPVRFVDFGMSSEALSWCAQRGETLTIVDPPHENPALVRYKALWELWKGEEIWSLRAAWFKKPLAFLASPFPQTIWIDLDCQINGKLEPLFTHLQDADIALVSEPVTPLFALKNTIPYNSGVVVFRKGAPILAQFASLATAMREECVGDQEVLALAIATHQTKVSELPAIYNWLHVQGENKDALIYHYAGTNGKQLIKRQSTMMN